MSSASRPRFRPECRLGSTRQARREHSGLGGEGNATHHDNVYENTCSTEIDEGKMFETEAYIFFPNSMRRHYCSSAA